MFFHPLNLISLVVVIGVFVAWFVYAGRDWSLRENVSNYVFLALTSGVLVRSFANEWWGLLIFGAVAAAISTWVILQRGLATAPLAAALAAGGVLVGIGLRDLKIWVALAVVVVLAVVAIKGKLPLLPIPRQDR